MRKPALIAMSAAAIGCGVPSDAPTEGGPAAAAASPSEHVPVPLTPLQEQGRLLYETMCWTCHGNAGRGDGPAVEAGSVGRPPTFHTQDYARSSVERLQGRFREGMGGADSSHPHMQYVASLLRPERFAEALSYLPALTYPPEIPGSALAGERLYQFRCAGCHGEAGDGAGAAASSLINVGPADFRSDTLVAAQNWDGLFARIREGGQQLHGSAMPPWGIVLSEPEMWDLVAYLATFQEGVLSRPRWMD